MKIWIENNDISLPDDKRKIDLSTPDNKIEINLKKQNVDIKSQNNNISFDVPRIELGATDHSQLDNLDYEHSGHTGFQPVGDYATNDRVDEVEAKIPTIPENIVIDEDYVHTDNNFTDEYKEKLDNESGSAESISYDDNYGYGVDNVQDALDEVYGVFDNMPSFDTSGDGSKYLGDDAEYHNIPSGGGSGDIAIPDITISAKVNETEGRLLRLNFGKYTQAFEDYVKANGVQIHLLKYTRSGRKTWKREKEDEETGETITETRMMSNVKKWIHPINQYDEQSPYQQCWGIRNFQRFEEYYGQIDDIIADADYLIPNDGIVQSVYNLTWGDFHRGYMEIKLDDIMRCVVRKYQVQNNDMDFLPYEGDNARVRIMGCRLSPRRARQRQPIKYVFTINQGKGFKYGNCNTVLLELYTYRNLDKEGNPKEIGYAGGFLPDIGYGVLIE